MNKTININLAGLFFHIDEDAYQRLQRYLAAVRKSFAGTNGADEIMSDIESRIAELFLEKRSNDQQVISIGHVEAVIDIMGQPEDYEVDEEIFNEAEPRAKRPQYNTKNKQLFRDTQNGYVGGVSAGLSYYLGIDAVWVRVLWILFLFLTSGSALLIYVILWIFVPDAVTTNQRLTMMGKEVNISNIEENFKSGFEPVVDGQTDADYRIVGQKGKRGTVKFFNTLGNIIMGLLKAVVKIFGLFLFLISTISLLALIVSSIVASFINIEGFNLLNMFDLMVPAEFASFWLVLAIILAIGIPLFLLAVLGLKLLVTNLRTLGTKTYIALAAVWIIAVIALSIMIGTIAASQAIDATVQRTEKFSVDQGKVFSLELEKSSRRNRFSPSGISIEFDEVDGQSVIKYFDVHVAVGSTTDSLARVELNLTHKGSNFEEAKEKAKLIQYDYQLTDSTFIAPDYFVLPKSAGLGSPGLEVMIYLPEGTKANFNERFGERYRSWISNDAFKLGNNIEYTYEIKDGNAVCLDCPVVEEKKEDEESVNDTIPNAEATEPVNDGEWQYDGEDGVRKNELP